MAGMVNMPGVIAWVVYRVARMSCVHVVGGHIGGTGLGVVCMGIGVRRRGGRRVRLWLVVRHLMMRLVVMLVMIVMFAHGKLLVRAFGGKLARRK